MTENASENLILKTTVKFFTKYPKSKNVSKNILKARSQKTSQKTISGHIHKRPDVKARQQGISSKDLMSKNVSCDTIKAPKSKSVTDIVSENLMSKPTVKNITKDPKSKNVSKNILKDLMSKLVKKHLLKNPKPKQRLKKQYQEYSKRPDVKARRKKYLQRPDAKARINKILSIAPKSNSVTEKTSENLILKPTAKNISKDPIVKKHLKKQHQEYYQPTRS